MELKNVIVERKNKTVYDANDKVIKVFKKGHNK